MEGVRSPGNRGWISGKSPLQSPRGGSTSGSSEYSRLALLPSTVRPGGLYLSRLILIEHVLWYLRNCRAVRPRQAKTGSSAGRAITRAVHEGALPEGNQPRQKYWPLVQHSLLLPPLPSLGWTSPLLLPLPRPHLFPLHWLDFRYEHKEEAPLWGPACGHSPRLDWSLSDRREPRSPLSRAHHLLPLPFSVLTGFLQEALTVICRQL